MAAAPVAAAPVAAAAAAEAAAEEDAEAAEAEAEAVASSHTGRASQAGGKAKVGPKLNVTDAA